MRQMQNMMSSFFGNPFAGNDMFGAGGGRSRSMSLMPFDEDRGMMSPFGGFPNMNQLMRGMGQMPQMSSNPNCHSFSSSSVMTMTTGPDGKPQVSRHSHIFVFHCLQSSSTNFTRFRFIRRLSRPEQVLMVFVRRKRALVTVALALRS